MCFSAHSIRNFGNSVSEVETSGPYWDGDSGGKNKCAFNDPFS